MTAVLLGMHRAFLSPRDRPGGRVSLEYEGEAVSLAVVRRDLGIPDETSRIVFRDGVPIGDETKLEDGDTITFVSPVSGG